ncbi:MAG: outer membrane beta-barrel protein [Pseudolabrys sp.]
MKTKFMAILVAAVAAAGTAAAADLPRGPAPYYYPPPAIYNWTGFYAGLNLGYEWGKVTNFSGDPSGIAGGGQLGYNWQVGQFVFGAETDIQVSGADDTFAPWKFSNPWFGTLCGRAGYAINNVLLFASAGLAYGNLTANLAGLEESKTLVGVSEWKLASRLTGQQRSSICTWILVAVPFRSPVSTTDCRQANLRFGVNYHF